MFYALKLLSLLLHLCIAGGIMRQLWHPYRSRLWMRAWGSMLLATIFLVGRRVYDLWVVVSLFDVVSSLGVSLCFVVTLWHFTRLFADDLPALPPLPHAHIIIDPTSTILAWDTTATHLFGYTAAEALGRTLGDTIIPAASREAHLQGLERYLAEPQTGRIIGQWTPLTACHKTGKLFTVELLVQPVTTPDGTLTFVGEVRQVFTL